MIPFSFILISIILKGIGSTNLYIAEMAGIVSTFRVKKYLEKNFLQTFSKPIDIRWTYMNYANASQLEVLF